jgi:hypothetical protein
MVNFPPSSSVKLTSFESRRQQYEEYLRIFYFMRNDTFISTPWQCSKSDNGRCIKRRANLPAICRVR